ncbi:FAD-dependent oxidoreductase [Actinomadura logoneensis]|uniref:FAD-dependent oxidoreductase n=1 Tax=Actinomadura logoneensis TaxID=2293572 RepID=A0A372J8N7_9ACTN|nr:FAD-dependent oxidoreductase [Actinomadura logoneensis]RFU36350.1 FAD-dependent oxidoreductase [Actinomadura logoneensis]
MDREAENRGMVAVVGPFSGPRASWGELLSWGIDAMAAQPVAWETFDDRGEAPTGLEVARRIVDDGRFAAVVGHFNSDGAALALPVYRAAGLAAVLPLATRTGLLRGQDGAAVRLCPDDTGQAVAIARACRRTTRGRLWAAHDGSAYGRRLVSLMAEADRGAMVVHAEGAKSLTSQAAFAPGDALALCGMHHQVAALLRGLRPDNVPDTVVVSDDCDIPEFAELAGSVVHRVRVARMAGGARGRVAAAFAATAGALLKRPELRGPDLLAAIRQESVAEFGASGDLADASPGAGWEVVPVATGSATPVRRVASAPVPKGESEPLRCEIAVVGGGVVGSAAAAEAAEAGRSVLLVDSGLRGAGASQVSGALVRAFEPDDVARESAIEAFLRFWGGDGAGSGGFRRTGALTLLGPDDVANAEKGVACLREARLPAELLTPAALAKRWPDINPTGLAGAVWEERGGYAVASVTMASLIGRGARAGVTRLVPWELDRIAEGPDAAAHLIPKPGRGYRPVMADAVVVAAGCSTPRLLGDRLQELGRARTKRIRYAIFDVGGRTLPTVVDLTTGVWGRPDGRDGFLAGCPLPEWDVPPESGGRVTAAQVETIRQRVSPLLPFLARAPFLTGAYGTDLFLPDGPLLRRVPGRPRTVVAAGWSGGGFKTAPAAARRAAAKAEATLAASGGGVPVACVR